MRRCIQVSTTKLHDLKFANIRLRARNFGGGDRLLNALLTEIEKHEGIVFMATNRPQEIDEVSKQIAMYCTVL